MVPPDATLGQLHTVLQVAMGWGDSHLHEFSCGGRRFGPPDPEEDSGTADENAEALSGVLGQVGAKVRYIYDFGDGWEHEIVLEKRLPADPKMVYPVCTAGKGACPPEDCGGLPGFYNLVEALQDPDHPSHDELREWLGGEYDAGHFSIADVNAKLARMKL